MMSAVSSTSIIQLPMDMRHWYPYFVGGTFSFLGVWLLFCTLLALAAWMRYRKIADRRKRPRNLQTLENPDALLEV